SPQDTPTAQSGQGAVPSGDLGAGGAGLCCLGTPDPALPRGAGSSRQGPQPPQPRATWPQLSVQHPLPTPTAGPAALGSLPRPQQAKGPSSPVVCLRGHHARGKRSPPTLSLTEAPRGLLTATAAAGVLVRAWEGRLKTQRELGKHRPALGLAPPACVFLLPPHKGPTSERAQLPLTTALQHPAHILKRTDGCGLGELAFFLAELPRPVPGTSGRLGSSGRDSVPCSNFIQVDARASGTEAPGGPEPGSAAILGLSLTLPPGWGHLLCSAA
ncbi:hypothetical protein Celaphus_00017278, partial [Cervus elaphus hippelaphus]